MRDLEPSDGGLPDAAEEQVLSMDATPGVGRKLLESLPPDAVVAYRGEPTASERAMLCWPMSDQERRDFAADIERVGDGLRNLEGGDVDRYLRDLGRHGEGVDLPVEPCSEEGPGSQDRPEERREGGNWSSRRARDPRRRNSHRIFVTHR